MSPLIAFIRRRFIPLSFALILGVSIWLISISAGHQTRGAGLLADLTLDISYIPLIIVETAISSVEGVWSGYFYLVDTAKNNRELERELARMKAERNTLLEASFENKRLRKLLGFSERTNWPLIPAEVIGRVWNESGRILIIGKGESLGVTVGMPVVSADGVVGQVVSAGRAAAKVLLIADPQSGLDAMMQESRSKGIMEGLSLRYLSYNIEIEIGERVITSGMGGVFPKGLEVGRVKKITRPEYSVFQQAEIEPSVNFSEIEEIFVVLKNPENPEELE